MGRGVVIVIPARQASQRYPGKPLAPIRGATGKEKPLIRRSWEAALRVSGIDRVIVATDNHEIAECASGFGAEVAMTSESCRNGTERCAEWLESQGTRPEVIVNLQGDAPLTPDWFVTAIVKMLRDRPELAVATPVVRCSRALYKELAADERKGIIGGTFAACSSRGQAHYFSKRIIPYFDVEKSDPGKLPILLHIGLYAYRPEALRQYASADPTSLELLEGLEQLRFLDLELPLGLAEVEAPSWDIWELNNPSDIPHIESSLAIMGVE